MNKIMIFFTLSCKRATALMEKRSLIRLSVKENIQLKFHTKLCNACSTYQKQSKEIDTLLEKYLCSSEEVIKPALVNLNLRMAILDKIK